MKCLAENDEHQVICRVCGSDKLVTTRENTIPCKQCGADNKAGDKECYSCHHPLG
jgi:ribosomal protein L40E